MSAEKSEEMIADPNKSLSIGCILKLPNLEYFAG